MLLIKFCDILQQKREYTVFHLLTHWPLPIQCWLFWQVGTHFGGHHHCGEVTMVVRVNVWTVQQDVNQWPLWREGDLTNIVFYHWTDFQSWNMCMYTRTLTNSSTTLICLAPEGQNLHSKATDKHWFFSPSWKKLFELHVLLTAGYSGTTSTEASYKIFHKILNISKPWKLAKVLKQILQ